MRFETGPATGAERAGKIRNIACIGEVMIELIAGPAGTATLGVAGDTYNTAVYLRRLLGGDDIGLSYVTALGSDPYSDRIVAHMHAHGLGTGYIERRPDRMPGLYAIDTDSRGERSFSYWRDSSAARTLFHPPCEIGVDRLNEFDLVFLTGISVAILPPDTRARLFSGLDAFRARGGLLAFDSNYRPRLWESVEIARSTTMEMWRRADISLPSLDDEMLLFGEDREEQVLQRLKDAGVGFGALKRGDSGPLDLSGNERAGRFPKAGRIVDTTAAGDSFNAGFLASFARGGSVADAMLTGHTLATEVIRHPGAIIDKALVRPLAG